MSLCQLAPGVPECELAVGLIVGHGCDLTGADEPFYPESLERCRRSAVPSCLPRPASGRLPQTFCPDASLHILPLPCR